MKVVLIRNAQKVGRAGQVIEVAEGYARNFLIPRGIAMPASESNLKQAAESRAVDARKRQRQTEALLALARKLAGLTLRFEETPAPSGKLYGGVSAQRIADELAGRGLEIRRQDIELPGPLKEPGEYPVTVVLGQGLRATVRCQVSIKQ